MKMDAQDNSKPAPIKQEGDMACGYIPFDWSALDDKSTWLEPCEESYYYAQKWKREGRRSLLDLGCGLVRQSVFFARCGFRVSAVDICD